jgi:hypothetical protein
VKAGATETCSKVSPDDERDDEEEKEEASPAAPAEETEQLIDAEPTLTHPTPGSSVGLRPATARSRAGHGLRR